MPRSLFDVDQVVDEDFLSPSEHTEIGDSAPHHARGHLIASTSDHDVTGPPTDGQILVWDAGLGKWKPMPQGTASFGFLIATWGGLVYDSHGELVLKG